MTTPIETNALPRPGWPEIAAALVTYLVLIIGLVTWIGVTPESQAGFRGIMGMAANGIAGGAALLVAWALRLRDFRAFGFVSVERKWLWIAAGLGLFAFGLSFLIEGVYFHFITEPNTQADFQAAATSGWLSLAILLVTGALFTPFGEEVVFRGVTANALHRYGPWVSIIGSAAIFGIVHGLSVITLLAFMVGLITGLLFYRTRSIWPALVVHCIYNGLHLLYYSTL